MFEKYSKRRSDPIILRHRREPRNCVFYSLDKSWVDIGKLYLLWISLYFFWILLIFDHHGGVFRCLLWRVISCCGFLCIFLFTFIYLSSLYFIFDFLVSFLIFDQHGGVFRCLLWRVISCCGFFVFLWNVIFAVDFCGFLCILYLIS